MVRTDDSAALAGNWRVVLAVDAGLGVVVSLIGVIVLLAVNAVVGMTLVLAGAAYATLVATRARRWVRLRRQAGL